MERGYTRYNLKHKLANTKTHKHPKGMDITPIAPTEGQKISVTHPGTFQIFHGISKCSSIYSTIFHKSPNNALWDPG